MLHENVNILHVNILKSNIYLYHYFAQEGVLVGLLYKVKQF